MTNVNSSSPVAQEVATATADPPTIKNAGKLHPAYPDIFGLVLVALMCGLVASGPLLQAVLTSHGRATRGLILNAAAGGAALAVLVGSSLLEGGEIYWESIIDFALAMGVIWLFLAILALTIGRVFRPRSLRRPRA